MTASPPPVVLAVSDKQPAAVHFAVAEAARRRTSLRVVHCYELPAAGAELYLTGDLVDSFRAAGESVLAETRALADSLGGTSAEYVLSNGSPHVVLVDESRHACELVLGADDIPWFDRMVGGAVAGHVARTAECPVIVVPEAPFPYAQTGGVVVTIDGDTSAAGPLRFGFEQADARSQTLHVLHAAPVATTKDDFDSHRANVAEIIAGWQEQFPRVHILVNTTTGDPVESCIAATAGSSLVVVGRPHGKATLALARPLAMQVIREARCPVAIVPSV
ncbi:MAG: hypothetical protein JWR55_1062 [Aeromicrobium sp.]|jgi:nucleotide-binding universal stress UspA family protein|nr:hypothetical protein [Aeromicrobium sp.]